MILNSRPSNITLKKKETTQELNETQNSFEYNDLRQSTQTKNQNQLSNESNQSINTPRFKAHNSKSQIRNKNYK